MTNPKQSESPATITADDGPASIIGYVNRYRGKGDAVWCGRTIFKSDAEGRSVPCATRDAYIDTCALVPVPLNK